MSCLFVETHITAVIPLDKFAKKSDTMD